MREEQVTAHALQKQSLLDVFLSEVRVCGLLRDSDREK